MVLGNSEKVKKICRPQFFLSFLLSHSHKHLKYFCCIKSKCNSIITLSLYFFFFFQPFSYWTALNRCNNLHEARILFHLDKPRRLGSPGVFRECTEMHMGHYCQGLGWKQNPYHSWILQRFIHWGSTVFNPGTALGPWKAVMDIILSFSLQQSLMEEEIQVNRWMYENPWVLLDHRSKIKGGISWKAS